MPQTQQILFLKDSSGHFRLRTDVQSFGFDDRSKQYYVIFSKAEKVLYYNPNRVDIAVFKQQLEPPFRVIRKSDGEVFYHVLGVRVYEGKYNKGYRVIYENGAAKSYPIDYLEIQEHIDDYRSINVWEYLNELAKYNKIPTDDDKTISLADKYSKMEFVEKGSLLEAYLNVNTYKQTPIEHHCSPIFPFGCNRSQYKAVCDALENPISIIQGPPGTGKTQTILNILANLLLSGKTMQIVSNNNSAVDNVREKLEANDLGFICAQLGRIDNKKAFIDNQSGEYPDIASWKAKDAKSLYDEAAALSAELQGLYKDQERLAYYSKYLSEYTLQLQKFPNKPDIRRHHSISLLKRLLFSTSRELERKQKLGWFTQLRLRFWGFSIADDITDTLQYQLTKAKIRVLDSECKELEEAIKDIDAKNERLRSLSMRVLKDYLARKCSRKKERTVFSIDEIYTKSREFLQEYPVVLSTTFSAASNINPAYKFDYLIMDEASQVDIAAGALALSCARNAVIVGDLKQLPNVVDNHTEEVTSSIFVKYQLTEAYKYATNSFLSSLCKLYPNIPQTLLREHYRCDPLIIGFCSKQFYDGELIPMKKSSPDFTPVRVIRTVKGHHARGTVNLRQVETVIQDVIPILEERFTDIGIIAPYNAQVNALHNSLEITGRHYVAATVHKFQGRENDAIVLSTVDNQVREFTDDPHLLNVAVSRAKKQFTLVVSAEEQPDSNIATLIDYIEYYQGGSQQSKITSIFDLLYEDYSRDLLRFYQNHKRVSEFDSENLAYWTIHDVIKQEGLSHLDILMHYPLRHLVNSASGLSDDEWAYASHPWTHIDFLIYDNVSHKAKLAIEVDGMQYHKADSTQGQRDRMKNSILAKINLPLLRLSTAGALEKDQIINALKPKDS